MTDKMKVAVEMDKNFLHWRAEFQPDEAYEFVAAVGPNNTASAPKLLDLLRNIDSAIPRQHHDRANNPNNGRTHHVYEIGNEYSRVLYLNIHKTYIRDWSETTYLKLADDLDHWGLEAGADERNIEINDGSRFTYRFWWD